MDLIRRAAWGVVCGVSLTAGASPQPAAISGDGSRLEGKPLGALAPFIGDWEIESAWADGTALWARNEYRVSMNGAFVEATTWAKDGDGEPYPRYRTVYSWDGDSIVATGFTFDGTVSTVDMGVPGDGSPLLVAEWGEYPARIRQWVDAPVDGAYRWRVWMLPSDDAEPVAMMDGMWKRAGAAAMNEMPSGPYPVDASLFVAEGVDLRSMSKEADYAAPPSAVFALFSSEEGLRKLYGIPSRIDLAVGGPYEWYFLDGNPYGTKGGEGNQVLAYIPDRLLVFSWNAPPTQPESRAKRTWVVMEFAEGAAGGTRLRLTHLGFGEGEKWDETYAYFDSAWGRVLQAVGEALE
jgi:uncharacterized protein YndB with AHSA1/START domain